MLQQEILPYPPFSKGNALPTQSPAPDFLKSLSIRNRYSPTARAKDAQTTICMTVAHCHRGMIPDRGDPQTKSLTKNSLYKMLML